MFDTEFDYSKVLIHYNEQLTLLNTQKTILVNKKSLIENSVYNTLLQPEVDVIARDIAYLDTDITNYQALIDEIINIQNLTVDEKNLIYYYYSVLGIEKSLYMVKMLFNISALTDPNVLAVYNDTTSSNEVKLLTAQLLYERFTIKNEYTQIYEIMYYI
jgi:hypothetical protein